MRTPNGICLPLYLAKFAGTSVAVVTVLGNAVLLDQTGRSDSSADSAEACWAACSARVVVSNTSLAVWTCARRISDALFSATTAASADKPFSP